MLWSFLKSQKEKDVPPKPLMPLRVVIMGRDENAPVDFKKVLGESFKSMPFLSVVFEDDFALEDLLNPDYKNFFDFFDGGIKALKKHNADVLLRFYSNGTQIRFNFLTPDMYLKKEPPFFSSLFGLYLPVSYFQAENLPQQISCLIGCTFIALGLKKDVRYLQTLKALIKVLSKTKMPQGIEKRFMPHILSFLAFNYLVLRADTFDKKDMFLISNLITSAQKSKDGAYDAVLEGTLLTLSGQMYALAANAKNADSYTFLERAAQNTRKALKYFNKYVFPYDYGHLSLILSKFYFSFFKFSENRQSLRDAVFYMREAEKIFTFATFPYLWADIEGDLGNYLTHLSVNAHSKEIAEVAVQNYKNRQKVFSKESSPLLWAETEKSIADVYYYLGKDLQNQAYFEKASNHYLDALDIFEDLKETEYVEMLENALEKTQEKILRLNQK